MGWGEGEGAALEQLGRACEVGDTHTHTHIHTRTHASKLDLHGSTRTQKPVVHEHTRTAV